MPFAGQVDTEARGQPVRIERKRMHVSSRVTARDMARPLKNPAGSTPTKPAWRVCNSGFLFILHSMAPIGAGTVGHWGMEARVLSEEVAVLV